MFAEPHPGAEDAGTPPGCEVRGAVRRERAAREVWGGGVELRGELM
jgi:hypothetical protein